MVLRAAQIGIDIGSTYTRAAIHTGTGIRLVPLNAEHEPCAFYMPTAAYITRGAEPKILLGREAEPYRFAEPDRFFCNFLDDLLEEESLVANASYTFCDLVTAIAIKVRSEAREIIRDVPLNCAHVTVPAHYMRGGPEWSKLRSAIGKAGFEEVVLIPEPLAAVQFYVQTESKSISDGLSLVIDWGGSGFRPSLVRCDAGEMRLLAYNSNGHSGFVKGGAYFDQLIYEACMGAKRIEPVPQDESGRDPGQAMNRLLACRQAKHILSTSQTADMPAASPAEGPRTITRKAFEDLISSEIDKALSECDQVLASNNVTWQDLRAILCVGGTCSIPAVRERTAAYIGALGANADVMWSFLQEGNQQIDPTCAMCCGAFTVNSSGGAVSMDSKTYEEKRNELIDLLNAVLKIEELPEQPRQEIEEIKAKCISNQFEVVLIGEFQGGKSTTFNAICDGREISPRGAMIKTSACKISAQNLADPQAEEYTEIQWRTNEELLLGMIDLLHPHLRRLAPERFLHASTEQMVYGGTSDKAAGELILSTGVPDRKIQPLNLHSEEDRALIGEALAQEWKTLKGSRASYDPDGVGKLDILRVSSIIFQFVDAPEIIELSQSTRYEVADIAQYVTFPENWDLRWTSCDARAFSPDEIAFAFIRSVRCHIHSPHLARLGCVVTDCPGLFASSWDTELARQAMLKADAILYLLGGRKTLTTGDIHALNEIRLTKQERKLFFAINIYGKLANIQNNIRPNDALMLAERGFDIQTEDIHLFHALLGLCGKNGSAELCGKLDAFSREAFVRTAQAIDSDYSTDFAEVWAQVSDENLKMLGRSAGSVDALRTEDLDRVLKYGQLDDLLEAIEKHVIREKASSILVNNGADKARHALEVIEGNLRSQEEAAQRTEAQFREAVVRARGQLEAFQADCRKQMARIEDEAVANSLAENFEESVILSNIPAISETATENIAENLLTFEAMGRRFWNVVKGAFTNEQADSLKEMLKPIFKDAVRKVCGPATEGWFENIRQGESRLFNATLGARVRDVEIHMQEAWESAIEVGHSDWASALLNGLDIDSSFDALASGKLFEHFDTEALRSGIKSGDTTNVAGFALGAVATGVTFIVAGVVAEIIAVVILGMATPLVIIYLPPLILAAMAGTGVFDIMKSRHAKKLRREIENGLRSGFNEPESKKVMRKNSLALVTSIQDAYIAHFHNQLEVQFSQFNVRVKEAERSFDRTEAERKALAKRLSELRRDRIQPLREEVQDYLVEVEKALGHKQKGTDKAQSPIK